MSDFSSSLVHGIPVIVCICTKIGINLEKYEKMKNKEITYAFKVEKGP